MLPSSYETALMSLQHRRGIGIFACDGYTVFSNKLVKIAPEVITRIVDKDLTCKLGGKYNTAMNTGIFLAVWEKVYDDGQFWDYGWTVKVDPDTVFFPQRLMPVLAAYDERPNGIYLKNCKYGLHGPLEIFSRNAVRAFTKGVRRCKAYFDRKCDGPCLWGEDEFIDQCLWKVLGVTRADAFGILQEDHCDPPDSWQHCMNNTIVAFHPFKEPDAHRNCVENSLTMSMRPRLTLHDRIIAAARMKQVVQEG